MALTARTFRVFVSSTFEDFVAERNLLQSRVFPALTEYCRARGAQFQAIDLRWGVSEQAGVDHRAIDICLAEIHRSQTVSPRPNFIILLGERYGWCPPPSQVPADAFERIAARVRSAADRDLLDEWYRRDENAVPPVRYLRPRKGEWLDYATWDPVERRLRAILEEAVAGTHWADDPRFVSSATEQEIFAGALNMPDAREHVFCFIRSTASGDADERLTRLKSRLRTALSSGVLDYQTSGESGHLPDEYLQRLADDVLAALTRVIDSELDLLEHQDPLTLEVARHRQFGAERARDFTGRDWALARIAVHLDEALGGMPAHPLVIHGASGAGKSALLARASIEAEREHPNAVTITRFLGSTPDSTNGRDLLESLCRQIVRGYSSAPDLVAEDRRELLDETTLPREYNDLVREFPLRIGVASARRPLHLFLDALDQLPATDPAHRLAWLPGELPEHVRLVASTATSTLAQQILQARLLPEQLFALDRMDQTDGEHLLDIWLTRAGRTLTPAQRAHVIERFELEGLPLYLRLAFEQARLWRSDDQAQLAIGIPGVIRTNLFARLAAEEEHGRTLVAHSLGYLAAAREGLGEDELLDLLSADDEVLAEFRRRSPRSPAVDRLPPIVWSRLYFDLEPYLAERVADGNRLLTFFHRQLREVIEDDYLAGADRPCRHRQIAEYFGDDSKQPLQRRAGGPEAVPNLRKLSELPYQQSHAGMSEEVTATLTDFAFLTAKVQYTGAVETGGDRPAEALRPGVYQLQADYRLALSLLPDLDSVVEEFGDALDREAHNIVVDPAMLFQQLYNRLQWTGETTRDITSRERARRTTPFLHIYTRLRESSAALRTLAADSEGCVAQVAAIPGTGLIVSAGYDPELKIWEPRTGELMNVLSGHKRGVETVVATPDGSRLVSVSRDATIRVWDVATGATLHTLPGHNDSYVRAFACRVSSDGRFAVVPAKGGGGLFNVWDLDDGALRCVFDGQGQVAAWTTGPTAVSVATLFSDGRLVTWNPLDGQIISASTASVPFSSSDTEVIFSADGARIIATTSSHTGRTSPQGSLEMQITVEGWDSRTLDLLWRQRPESAAAKHDQFPLGADSAVIGRSDRSVVVARGSGIEPTFAFVSGQLSPDGSLFVALNQSGDLRLWDTRTNRLVGDLVGHGGQIQNWVYTDDGLIGTSCDDGTVRIWDPSKLNPNENLPGHVGPVYATDFSPDGTLVVSAGQTNDQDPDGVKLWSVDDGSLSRGIDANEGDWGYAGTCFTTYGNDLVAGGPQSVTFWRSDGSFIGRWNAPYGNAVFASIEGQWVLGGAHRGLSILDSTTGEPMTTVSTEAWVNRAMLTHDGHVIFGVSEDGAVQTWNASDLSRRTHAVAHDAGRVDGIFRVPATNDLAVSPDSRHGVIADGADGTIHLWDLATGAETRVLSHTASAWGCCYSPDGTVLISRTGDGSLWGWDTQEPALARELASHSSPARLCVVAPDGRLVVSGHDDRSLFVRDLASGEAVTRIMLPALPMTLDLHPWRPVLVCGDQVGNVLLIEMVGVEYGPIVVTPREHLSDARLFVRCPRCLLEHRVDHAQLGGQHQCPTDGCGLPLRVNAFFSAGTPPANPVLEEDDPITGPLPVITDDPEEVREYLLTNLWCSADSETWVFWATGTVMRSGDPGDGTWTLDGTTVRVIYGEYHMKLDVDVGSDRLSGGMLWRGLPDSTWIPLTLERVLKAQS